MRIFIPLLAFVVFLGGCSSTKVASSNQSKAVAVEDTARFDSALLYGKTWSMVKIESGDKSIDVPTDVVATLVFDKKTSRIHGRCCNSYFGAFVLAGNVLTFDKMGATKMLCMGLIGDIESLYHSLLAAPQIATVDESMLILKSDKGTVTFRANKEAE